MLKDRPSAHPDAVMLGPNFCGLALCCGLARARDEKWRRSVTWPTLWASDLGRVATILRRGRLGPAEIAPTSLNIGTGYRMVRVTRRQVRAVARVVCDAWHGPPPFAGAMVRHLDGSRTDDRPGNLAWGSARDNAADACRHGSLASTLSAEDAAAILIRLHLGEHAAALARSYGVSVAAVISVGSGRTWRHVLPDLVRPGIAPRRAARAALPVRRPRRPAPRVRLVH